MRAQKERKKKGDSCVLSDLNDNDDNINLRTASTITMGTVQRSSIAIIIQTQRQVCIYVCLTGATSKLFQPLSAVQAETVRRFTRAKLAIKCVASCSTELGKEGDFFRTKA